MTTHRMLIVEDNIDGQEVIARILQHHHIDFDLATTAEEALGYLAGNDYDAAIIDLSLPVMDGWSLQKIIRQQADTASLPCIAITAYHSVELVEQAFADGFRAYFSKPIDTTAFVRELQTITT